MHKGLCMKKFTIEVSHATPAQLSTIALELKIMGNAWEKFGPRITINSHKLQAPRLREPSRKQQATSPKHNMNTFQ
jgi:phenylacetate-coenzyme A ligase PaaK-like adenylate-forming protein